MFSLTPSAVSEVKRILTEQGVDDMVLRLGVSGGGCSGFSYVMTFDKEVSDADSSIDYDGLKVVMAPEASPYIGNIVLDFRDEISKRGFEFNNPDAADNCGCGNSFSV
jgi:iron-sulfur cluster assembly accessory protein